MDSDTVRDGDAEVMAKSKLDQKDEIKTKIRLATMDDLKYIDSLAQKEGKSIGFLPKVVYEAAITGLKPSKHRWSPVCNDKIWIAEENGDTVGFVLAGFGQFGKIHQICIQEDARLLERGKLLLNSVISHAETRGRYDFSCGCADDLESNKFWNAMGWIKVGERKGISYKNVWKESSDRKVNIYRYAINELGFLDQLKIIEEVCGAEE